MKNKSFPLNFVATLTLVLISTVVLSACSPQPTATVAPEASATPVNMEVQSSPSTSSAAPESMTTIDENGNQVLTLEPTYISPGGEERIRILLTLADGVVTEAEAISLAKHPTSQQMQAGFVEEFSGDVVGKSLAELENIDRIGGASLTTGAFRQAITQLNQS